MSLKRFTETLKGLWKVIKSIRYSRREKVKRLEREKKKEKGKNEYEQEQEQGKNDRVK